MIPTPRDTLRAWLQAHPPHRLAQDDETGLTKAGLLPFLPTTQEADWQILVMRPRGDKPALGPPPLQICKGTRMARIGGDWSDMRKKTKDYDESESLAETALREAEEELGIQPNAIIRLYDLGNAGFASASTSKGKYMRLFAAELKNREDLLPMAHIAATTAERRWLSFKEFAWQGREDHVQIAANALSRLQLR
jgi:ADP-ribose pyrophosphatase YjhB (NUDIX family)